MIRLGTLPYPEWRIRTVNRAHQAGMGGVGKAMEWVLRNEIWSYEPVVRRGSMSSRYDENGDANNMVDQNGIEDLSDLEWEGWTRDLERQSQM